MSSVPQIAWVCDQDAYACSGQKCSAQSILIAHTNWVNSGIFELMEERASHRSLEDLSVGPVLSWTTEQMLQHVEALLKIPGMRISALKL